jgi:hypothetical protein
MKRLVLMGMLTLMLVLMTSAVMGAVGVKFTHPLSSSTANCSSGTYDIVVEVGNSSQEQWNATFYIRATGASTWTEIGSNATENLTQYNESFSIGTYTYDTKSYVFNVTMRNGTGSNGAKVLASNTSTGVVPDCTDPIASITVPVASTEYSDSISFSASASNATNCSLWVGNQNIKTKLIANGSSGSETCTATITTDDIPEGYNDWVLITYDRNGDSTTSSTVSSVALFNQLSGVRGRIIDEEEGRVPRDVTKDGMAPGAKLLIVVLIGYGIYYYMGKK